ncbi:hypothetical protein [Acetobacter sicerae]|uniref:hypothetical protein n=1 Tax=Acetobacter sicerae TaxID=85325 RepID=UPI00156B8B3E|nr:hypothetical protein [Acetobacter sicerae]NHN91823.1 hypothetical protein [Acetobacter sicerae]
MRAFHGQLSDNQPIRRTLAEKQKQLRDLKETLASMKSHTAPALRDSVRKRIAQLEAELTAAPALKSSSDNRTQRPAAARAGEAPRRPRSRIRSDLTG